MKTGKNILLLSLALLTPLLHAAHEKKSSKSNQSDIVICGMSLTKLCGFSTAVSGSALCLGGKICSLCPEPSDSYEGLGLSAGLDRSLYSNVLYPTARSMAEYGPTLGVLCCTASALCLYQGLTKDADQKPKEY